MQRRFVPVVVSFAVLCSLFYALSALAQEESAPPVSSRIEVSLLVEIGLPGAEPMSVTLPITLTIDVGPLLQGSLPLTAGVNVTVRIPLTGTATEGELQEPSALQEPLTPTAVLTPTIVITPSIPAAGDAPITNANVNFRAGPGTEFAVVGGAAPNLVLDLVARNETGDWLQLSSGLWIAAFLVDNAPEDLPLAVVIPTPPQPVTSTLVVTPTVALTTTPQTEPVLLVPTPTAGVDDVPVANANAFLRGGPGTGFPIVGNAVAGEALLLVARNEDGAWLQIRNGDWIAAFLVDNEPADLPVAAEAPVLGLETEEEPDVETDDATSVPVAETPVPIVPTPTPQGTAP